MHTLFFYFQKILIKVKSYLPDTDNLDWLDGMTFLICSWFTIFPFPSFTILFCIIALIPILGITLTVLKGNANFDSHIKKVFNKDGVEQNIISTYIMLSAFTLALGVYRNFECESYYSLLTHGAIAFLIFGVTFFFTHLRIKGTLKHRFGIYIMLAICILFYSYGVTYGVNCLFDQSSPERFQIKVIDKHKVHHRKSADSYYLTITPWGHHHDTEDLPVSSEQYDYFNPEDRVYIDLQEGCLGIPWYHIENTKIVSDNW